MQITAEVLRNLYNDNLILNRDDVLMEDKNVECVAKLNINKKDDGLFIYESKLIFTINGLFQTLIKNNELTYKQFRSKLYASRINEELREHGFIIEIYHSTKKVNTNYYQLSKINTEKDSLQRE